MVKKKKGSEGTDWAAFISAMDNVASTPLPKVEDDWAFREGPAGDIAAEIPLDGPKDAGVKRKFKDWDYLRSFEKRDTIGGELRVVHNLSTLDIEWAIIDPEGKVYNSVPAISMGDNLVILKLHSLNVEIGERWYVAVKPLIKEHKQKVATSNLQKQFKGWDYFRSFCESDLKDKMLQVLHCLDTLDIEWVVVDSEGNICHLVDGNPDSGGNLLTLDFSSLTFKGTWYVAVRPARKEQTQTKVSQLKTLTCGVVDGVALTQVRASDLVDGIVRIIHNLNSTELDMVVVMPHSTTVKKLKTSGPSDHPNQFIINLSCLGEIDDYVILRVTRKGETTTSKLRDKTRQRVSSLHISLQKISDTTYKGSVFSSVSLSHVTFIGCDFSNVTFNSASLSDVQFKDCILIGTKFTSCSLNVCGFSGGTVDKVVLQSCNVRSSKLPTNGMNFSGDSSISNCNMSFL